MRKVEAKIFQDQGHCQTFAPSLCPLVCINPLRYESVSFSDLMLPSLSHLLLTPRQLVELQRAPVCEPAVLFCHQLAVWLWI